MLFSASCLLHLFGTFCHAKVDLNLCMGWLTVFMSSRAQCPLLSEAFLLSVFGGGGLVAKLCPTLCDPMDCSSQAPLSVGFSRQGYWSGLPFPSPGNLSHSGFEPASPALTGYTQGSQSDYKPKRFLNVLLCLTNHPSVFSTKTVRTNISYWDPVVNGNL